MKCFITGVVSSLCLSLGLQVDVCLLVTQANSWYRKSPKISTVKEMSSLRKTLGGPFGGGTGRAPQWTLVWCVEEFVSVPPASTNTETHMIPGVTFNILTYHCNNLTSKVCFTFTFINSYFNHAVLCKHCSSTACMRHHVVHCAALDVYLFCRWHWSQWSCSPRLIIWLNSANM